MQNYILFVPSSTLGDKSEYFSFKFKENNNLSLFNMNISKFDLFWDHLCCFTNLKVIFEDNEIKKRAAVFSI